MNQTFFHLWKTCQSNLKSVNFMRSCIVTILIRASPQKKKKHSESFISRYDRMRKLSLQLMHSQLLHAAVQRVSQRLPMSFFLLLLFFCIPSGGPLLTVQPGELRPEIHFRLGQVLLWRCLWFLLKIPLSDLRFGWTRLSRLLIASRTAATQLEELEEETVGWMAASTLLALLLSRLFSLFLSLFLHINKTAALWNGQVEEAKLAASLVLDSVNSGQQGEGKVFFCSFFSFSYCDTISFVFKKTDKKKKSSVHQ